MNGRESFVKSLLAHPLTRGLDIDDPNVTRLRQEIVKQNEFLSQIYLEWYRHIDNTLLEQRTGLVLELGSGAGFLKEVIPDVITSDLFPGTGVDLILDGQYLPVGKSMLSGLVLINVLHHIMQPLAFFKESARCIVPGGKIVMIEPWVSTWSKIIYTRFHHEPFSPTAQNWRIEPGGPLSGANGAMPWIIFNRDRHKFEHQCPEWRIERIQHLMPFSYLASGGVSMRQLMPGWSFSLWRKFEALLSPWIENLAMFALIELKRSTYGFGE